MISYIEKNGKTYKIETGYGFNPNHSTVHEYDSVDEFGRLLNGNCIFMGTWEECNQFVKNL